MKFIRDDGGREAAGFQGSTGDCVARAIAIVAELPYTIVYDRLSEGNATQRITKHSGRRKSAGVRTAAHGIWVQRQWFKDYMRELGFAWHACMGIGTGCKVHLADGELPMGRLVCSLSRHYTAVIDGVIHDTYNPSRDVSWSFVPDHGQELKANQGRNPNGVYTEIGGRCVYGYYKFERM